MNQGSIAKVASSGCSTSRGASGSSGSAIGRVSFQFVRSRTSAGTVPCGPPVELELSLELELGSSLVLELDAALVDGVPSPSAPVDVLDDPVDASPVSPLCIAGSSAHAATSTSTHRL